jgi:outer membrane protein OmpA-like peptidoglycan-associated protein
MIFITFLGSVSVSGQNTKKGDKAFSRSEYFKAIQEYTAIEDKVTDPATQSHINFQIAESYRRMNQPDKAEPYYVKAIKGGYMSSDVYFGYGEVLLKMGKYDLAKNEFETFKRSNPENKLVDAKIASCAYGKITTQENPKYKLQPMETLNTKGSEYGIAYFNSNLIYASTGNPPEDAKAINISPRTGLPYSKFYMSVSHSGSYNKGEETVGLNKNTNANQGSFAYDVVNKLGYYTRCTGKASSSQCYIYFAEFKNNQWKEIDNLKIESRKMPIGHPFVMPNGKRIYFVSVMEGGYGKSDIWYTDKLPDGTWSRPINLGKEVNTPGNEFFPFVSEGYLFFTSEGHAGFGGLDIYASKIDGNVHGKAVNLGRPFNSSQDDLNLIEKQDASEGMLVSARRLNNSDDIFRFDGFPSNVTAMGRIYDSITGLPLANVPIDVKKNGKVVEKLVSDENGNYTFFLEPDSSTYELSANVLHYNPIVVSYATPADRFATLENWDLPMLKCEAFISGVVTGFERERGGTLRDLGPLAGAKVIVFENGIQVKVVETDNSGEYRFGDIKEDSKYEVRGIMEGYFIESNSLQVGKLLQSIDFCTANGYNMDLALEKIKENIQLNNILYDYNKATLRPESMVELDKFVSLLQKNPHMKIEIRSHTDSRGSVKYNNKLSQERAKSVVDYLIAKGIPASRLTPKGYGESMLLVKPEKTEDDYQANRRTEFTVTGMTGEALYDTRMPVSQTIAPEQIPIAGPGQYQQYPRQPQRQPQYPSQYPQQQYPQQQYPQQQQQQYQQQPATNAQNMPFRIQVFASSKYDLSKPEFHRLKQQFNLDVYAEFSGGVYRYFVGGYSSMAEAKAMCDRINSMFGTQYFPKAK